MATKTVKGYTGSPNLVGTTPVAGNTRTGSSTPTPTPLPEGVGGAITASGEIVGKGGVSLGKASSKDTYNPATVEPTPTQAVQDPTMGVPTKIEPPTTPATSTDPRQRAIDDLKKLGYQSPDEGEIAAQMAESSSSVIPGQSPVNVNQYAKAADMLKSTAVPTDSGLASGMASNAVRTFAAPEANPMDAVIQQDEYFTNLVKDAQEYFSPENQRTSLADEYKRLTKVSGIEEIDTELINAKNIIEGTEDDIRNEVTAAAGFATDSQVVAMANARNKSLIKNYNKLLDYRNSKQEYINTMIGLEAQDRANADKRFDSMMNFSMQILDYRDKMARNAQSSMEKVIEAVGGYKNMYNAYRNDPYSINLIEKTMGLGKGGLAQIAAFAPEPKRDTQTVAYGNGQALIDSNTGEIINTYMGKDDVGGTGASLIDNSPETRRTELVNLAKELLSDDATGKGSAVGASLAKTFDWFGGLSSRGLQPNRVSFETKVDNLKANLTLDNLKLLKGAMSDKDLQFLQAVGSTLNTNTSEKEFNDALRKVITKLGGDTEDTGSIPKGTDGAAYGYPGYVSDGTQWVLK